MSQNQLYRGSLATIILQLLQQEGMMYGYEITQKVKELTNGTLDIKEGALYPSLHKLEADGQLTVTAKKVDNRIRKYYELTPYGETETVNRLKELQDYLEMMQQFIDLKPQMK
ncbi:MAG: PadR family transcriptional regulator [Nonlabens sp.]|nr:PadR family transcriptional regulator [Nonlabens sp.]